MLPLVRGVYPVHEFDDREQHRHNCQLDGRQYGDGARGLADDYSFHREGRLHRPQQSSDRRCRSRRHVERRQCIVSELGDLQVYHRFVAVRGR